LLAGVAAWLLGAHHVADTCWITATVIAIGPATWSVIRGLRQGRVGVDVIAVLSLIGTLAVGEYLAGALVVVMLATGQALEHAAERRATKDLRSLLNRAPRAARRRVRDGVEVVPAEAVVVGDQLVVGSGEVLPVDGRLISDAAVLDESALTGESVLVEHRSGDDG
jgi:cation transport ATPase